ncbi:interferon-inducible GTPase 5-like [Hoplias malabaricus]|uniref:interferon-inducible GTPase 5-like n=1 Tax=Hoplias malabaricus TaxID=27720 RepID=UPI003462752B
MESQPSDINEAIEASGEVTLEQATNKAKEETDSLLNVRLDIAVTGETGSGKSSLVNALRGLKDSDEDAAPVGVTETTTEPTPYQHPTMPNVTLWDLPGIGSSNFKAKTYLKNVKFDRYDFFLIVSSGRFRENDIMLAKEIKKKKKVFYFVRSKTDLDVQFEKERKGIDKEETLSNIRRNSEEELKGIGNPKIFLVSSWDTSEFDFEKLIDTLESELPEHKQSALLQSVPVYSVAILERKVRMFQKAAWAVALASGAIAVAPVPGLSVSSDIAMVGSFFTSIYHSFGLDDKSLERLSERVNKPHLKSLKMSPLVEELIQMSSLRLGASALGVFLCSLVPVAGSAAAAAISFTTTRTVLLKGLDALAEEARKVLREAGLE